MPPHMVRCVQVTKTEARPPTRMDRFFGGQQPAKGSAQSDSYKPPTVKAKATGPLTWVTFLGFSLSVALFITSIIFGDGMSLLATILLSFLSTLVGIGNKWSLRFQKTAQGSEPPPGDVVIRYPNGSFLIVKCDENVARELYFAPEEIDYRIKSRWAYRMVSLVGTLMLMLGVIFLANARLELQFGWVGAYITINAAHWIAAALEPAKHWDLSRYTVREQGVNTGPASLTFTEALWKAVMLTKDTRWTKNGKAALPQTEVWDMWAHEAQDAVQSVTSRVGKLTDHWWRDSNIVWEDPEQWDPKEVWNRLNNEHATAARSHALPVALAA